MKVAALEGKALVTLRQSSERLAPYVSAHSVDGVESLGDYLHVIK